MYRLLFILVLLSSQLFGQHLNQFGHFIDQSYVPLSYTLSASGTELETEGLKLKGNTVFKTSYGFVTLMANDESHSSYLRLYAKDGKEVFKQLFPQVINFMQSPARNFCALYDGEHIYSINVKNGEIKKIQGSAVFAVNDAGEIACYDEIESAVIFKNEVVKIGERVFNVVFFKGRPLFVTKNSIVAITNNAVGSVFNSIEARVFSVKVFNDRLYISVKKETPEAFIFNSFTSDDLLKFYPGEKKRHELAHAIHDLKSSVSSLRKNTGRQGESIRCPLNYYQDTVYQPVGNSYNEIQEYNVLDPYVHPGVDLLGDYMQDVYSVKNGRVKAVLTTGGTYYWRVAISNKNSSTFTPGYLYAHLEETSIPYAVGDSVQEGDVIGQLVDFPVEGFVHCHFARIASQGVTWNGNWWTFDNPLKNMINFFDTIPPQFEKTINNDVFAFRDANGTYLSPDSLFGNVHVVSKVYDRINSDWHVDIHKIRYTISPFESPQNILLDSLAFEYNYYNDNYFAGTYMNLVNTLYSRDIDCYSAADYSIRNFYHVITNSDGNDTIDSDDLLQSFKTYDLPDGDYIFRVIASDPSENTAVDSMTIRIRNGVAGLNESFSGFRITVAPNPFTSTVSVVIHQQTSSGITYTIRNIIGQIVFKEEENKRVSSTKTLDLGFLPKGVYLLEVTVDENKVVQRMVKD